MSAADWRALLRERLQDSPVAFDAPLRRAVTLRVGGPADALVELESERDLLAACELAAERELPVHVLGRGSNVLVRDEGLRGVVLRLGQAFRALRVDVATCRAEAGAGLANASFVEGCREHGLGGMEFLVAIPGSIGGAIAMNAGAHDGETAAYLEQVRFYEAGGGVHSADAQSFAFAYRHSALRANEGRLVLGGTFRLRSMPDAEIRERRDRIQQWRREHQPREFPNCGSVFKNPPGDFAARLIDAAGLKGRQMGGAQVSEKHANFIVNRGDATAADVLALVDVIRDTVHSRTGISLELEMQVFPLPAREPRAAAAS
ncbi:MAG TPA: UDP-N-acetylmuramate dehydrogenase [bacterium]|nr:UDP-N-acetylmuramate dehydrogenase [bacterium]